MIDVSHIEASNQLAHQLLLESNLTISVAESCTGGLLGFLLSKYPGSSNYFLGGVICYSNQSKIRDLGIDAKLLDSLGAVSKECAEQMARNVRSKFASDLGISITGIAGPGGCSKEKPIGTVYLTIAYKKADAEKAETHKLAYNSSNIVSPLDTRQDIRFCSAKKALELIIKQIS